MPTASRHSFRLPAHSAGLFALGCDFADDTLFRIFFGDGEWSPLKPAARGTSAGRGVQTSRVWRRPKFSIWIASVAEALCFLDVCVKRYIGNQIKIVKGQLRSFFCKDGWTSFQLQYSAADFSECTFSFQRFLKALIFFGTFSKLIFPRAFHVALG